MMRWGVLGVTVALLLAPRAILNEWPKAGPGVARAASADIHVRGGTVTARVGLPGNTLVIEITGVPKDLRGYSVVAEYDEAVLAVTAVGNAAPAPLTLCIGNETTVGGGADNASGRFAFESTCGAIETTGLPGGPAVELARVTFQCLAAGTSPIAFDSITGVTMADAFASVGALNPAHTNAAVDCMPSACPGDTDCDGLQDSYEQPLPCLNLSASDAYLDTDGDGLTAASEAALGTDACVADTDRDGCKDNAEAANQGVKKPDNPLDPTDFPNIDGNGKVEFGEFSALLGAWNSTPATQRWDMRVDWSKNGKAEFEDFVILINAWNRTCP